MVVAIVSLAEGAVAGNAGGGGLAVGERALDSPGRHCDGGDVWCVCESAVREIEMWDAREEVVGSGSRKEEEVPECSSVGL